MTIKVGINGFGRIGRVVYRIAYNHPEMEVVAINDLTDAKTLAHLLKYDSTHGVFPEKITSSEGMITVGDKKVHVSSERDPAKLQWGALGVDIVLESTGVFRSRDAIEKHLHAGAKKVLLSVPSKTPEDVDATVVLGINTQDLTSKTKLISNASCTTNCLAPIVKAVHDKFGVKYGLMTTIHSYTNDQMILDLPHKDLRRARSAGINMIPTSTGAAKAIGLVIPELKGKLNGMAVRVPTHDGSLVDVVLEMKQDVTVEDMNNAVREAAEGPLKGILEYSVDPLVSSDIIGNPHSSIFDSLSTMKIGERLFKMISWYDNEFGYSSRCVDLIKMMADLG